MGRRPNRVVAEFFSRGKKLDDASNRYEHTCRRCGELFPKGRVDGLMSHILRKCPRVTQQDREFVLNAMQQAVQKSKPESAVVAAALPPTVANGDSPTPQGPLAISQPQSALDTLAEVSRRHLDFRQAENGQVNRTRDSAKLLADRLFLSQLQQANDSATAPGALADTANLWLTSSNVSPTQASIDAATLASSALAGLPFTQPDIAVTQQPQVIQRREEGSALDPQLDQVVVAALDARNDDPSAAVSVAVGVSRSASSPVNLSWTQRLGETSAPTIASANGFNLPEKSSRTKLRSRFSEQRRKQVGEIRKRGACLRCRMLKKPCSDDDPCSTCRSVESARIWKGNCLRTKLAEVFTLWSAGFHSSRIEKDVAILGLIEATYCGRVAVRFSTTSDFWLTLPCQTHRNQPLNSTSDAHGIGAYGRAELMALSDAGEPASEAIRGYVHTISNDFVEDETSGFVAATLKAAGVLLQEDHAENRDVSERSSARSCYNLYAELLEDCVELWIETLVLCEPERLDLRFDNHSSHEDDQSLPDITPRVQKEGFIRASHGQLDSLSRSMIQQQLLAVVERRAGKLSKKIMNELERRLLQRQQVSHFATFISAVILLSAAERMTGLYRSYSSVEVSANSPLQSSCEPLWRQGDRFASLLDMLLCMRALPPRTTQTQDGLLMATKDQTLPTDVNGRAKRQNEEQLKAAAWLDQLNLSVTELMDRRDAPEPVEADGTVAWEMRFVSRLLLPERTKK